MANIEHALQSINEAIDALSLQVWRGTAPDQMERVEGPDCTIVIELDRIDRALGLPGKSMFAPMAEQVKQAVIALYEAREALK